jgi:hypothetical protein
MKTFMKTMNVGQLAELTAEDLEGLLGPQMVEERGMLVAVIMPYGQYLALQRAIATQCAEATRLSKGIAKLIDDMNVFS